MKVPCKFKIKASVPCVRELEDTEQYVELVISSVGAGSKSKQLEAIQLEAKKDKSGREVFTGIANFVATLWRASDGTFELDRSIVKLMLEASGEDLGGGTIDCGRIGNGEGSTVTDELRIDDGNMEMKLYTKIIEVEGKKLKATDKSVAKKTKTAKAATAATGGGSDGAGEDEVIVSGDERTETEAAREESGGKGKSHAGEGDSVVGGRKTERGDSVVDNDNDDDESEALALAAAAATVVDNTAPPPVVQAKQADKPGAGQQPLEFSPGIGKRRASSFLSPRKYSEEPKTDVRSKSPSSSARDPSDGVNTTPLNSIQQRNLENQRSKFEMDASPQLRSPAARTSSSAAVPSAPSTPSMESEMASYASKETMQVFQTPLRPQFRNPVSFLKIKAEVKMEVPTEGIFRDERGDATLTLERKGQLKARCLLALTSMSSRSATEGASGSASASGSSGSKHQRVRKYFGKLNIEATLIGKRKPGHFFPKEYRLSIIRNDGKAALDCGVIDLSRVAMSDKFRHEIANMRIPGSVFVRPRIVVKILSYEESWGLAAGIGALVRSLGAKFSKSSSSSADPYASKAFNDRTNHAGGGQSHSGSASSLMDAQAMGSVAASRSSTHAEEFLSEINRLKRSVDERDAQRRDDAEKLDELRAASERQRTELMEAKDEVERQRHDIEKNELQRLDEAAEMQVLLEELQGLRKKLKDMEEEDTDSEDDRHLDDDNAILETVCSVDGNGPVVCEADNVKITSMRLKIESLEECILMQSSQIESLKRSQAEAIGIGVDGSNSSNTESVKQLLARLRESENRCSVATRKLHAIYNNRTTDDEVLATERHDQPNGGDDAVDAMMMSEESQRNVHSLMHVVCPAFETVAHECDEAKTRVAKVVDVLDDLETMVKRVDTSIAEGVALAVASGREQASDLQEEVDCLKVQRKTLQEQLQSAMDAAAGEGEAAIAEARAEAAEARARSDALIGVEEELASTRSALEAASVELHAAQERQAFMQEDQDTAITAVLNDMNMLKSEADEEKRKLSNQIMSMQEEMRMLREAASDMEAQSLAQQHDQQREMETKGLEMAAEIERLLASEEEMIGQLRAKEEALMVSMTESQSAQQAVTEMGVQMATMREREASHAMEIEELQRRIDDMTTSSAQRSVVDEDEGNKHEVEEQAKAKMMAAAEDSAKMVSSLESTVAALRQEMEDAETRSSEGARELEAKLRASEEAMADRERTLTAEVDAMQSRAAEMEAKAEDASSKLASVKELNMKILGQLKASKQEHKAAVEDGSATATELEAARARLAEVEAEKASLEEELTGAIKSVQESHSQLELADASASEASDDGTALRAALESIEKEKALMGVQLSQRGQELEKQQRELTASLEKLEQSEASAESLRAEMEEKVAAVAALEARESSLMEEMAALKRELSDGKARVDALEAQAESVGSETVAAAAKADEEMRIAAERHQSALTDAAAEKAAISEKLARLEAEAEAQAKLVDRLQSEAESHEIIRMKYDDQKLSFESLMQSSQESISEANTKIHDLETTMSSVKQSLESKEEEYNAVVSELAEVKMTVATMRSEEMDNESTLAELRKARGMITDMEARADNVTQELTAHFSQQIEVLTQKLLDSQEAKAEINELLEASKDALEKQSIEAKISKDALTKALEDLQAVTAEAKVSADAAREGEELSAQLINAKTELVMVKDERDQIAMECSKLKKKLSTATSNESSSSKVATPFLTPSASPMPSPAPAKAAAAEGTPQQQKNATSSFKSFFGM